MVQPVQRLASCAQWVTNMKAPLLCVRVHAGLNASVFLAGILGLVDARLLDAASFAHEKFPQFDFELALESRQVRGITGLTVRLSEESGHAHRNLVDIFGLYEKSTLSPTGLALAKRVWCELAKAEASVHDTTPQAVCFHEVGRLSNVLCLGLIGELVSALRPMSIASSPLPMGDGEVRCAHGIVPNPAPATLAMLDGVAVRPFAGTGEAVTPTGLAILKGLGARFGSWPAMHVTRHCTAFLPTKTFEDVANGVIFALGEAIEEC